MPKPTSKSQKKRVSKPNTPPKVVSEAIVPIRSPRAKPVILRTAAPEGTGGQFIKGRPRVTNQYMETLLDPEKYRGVRFPDGFQRATAMSSGLIMENLPYFSDAQTAETPGSYYAVIRPSLVHPVWVYGSYTFGANNTPTTALSIQSDDFGFYPLTKGKPGLSAETNELLMQESEWVNVKAPLCWRSVDWNQWPFKSELSDGTVFYGHPISGVTSATSRTMNLSVEIDGDGLAIGDAIHYELVDAYGHSVNGSIVSTVANQQDYIAGGINLDIFYVGTGDAEVPLAIPKPGIGLRLRFTSATRKYPRSVYSVKQNFYGTEAASGKQYCLYPIDLPEQDAFINLVDLFRVVSMAAWVQYQGAALTDGGQHSALLYRGGAHPNELRFDNYLNISEVDRSYQGPSKLGSYSIWLPSNQLDTIMREPVQSHDWSHPYIVIAGVVASPDVVNTLRLRVPINYEIVSKSQLLSYASSKPHPEWITMSSNAMRDFPSSMENPLHWKAISDVLKKAVGVAQDVYKWYGDNKSWINPAAGALGSLLL